MDINLENNHNNNQSIINKSTEYSLKENVNNLIESNSDRTTINEKTFDTILKNIKEENNFLVPEYVSDVDDLDLSTDFPSKSSTEKSMNKITKVIKKKKVHKKRKSKPINKFHNNIKDESNKKDLNNYESNLQRLGHTISISKNNQPRSINSSHLSNNQNKERGLSNVTLFKLFHDCGTYCEWCKETFAVYDNPNHIGRIRNIEKQKSFLKIESTLKLDSCLCDRCWKYLEKTHKYQENEKRIGNTLALNLNDVTELNDNAIENTVNKSVMPNTNSKTNRCYQQKNTHCSVYKCMKNGIHLIFKDDYVIIHKIFSKFNISNLILIEKKNKNPIELNFPCLLLCEEHLLMINVITTCQICCNRLNYNLNPDVWDMYYKWNRSLEYNKIPLSLIPGMFICMVCESHVLTKDFSSYDLELVRYNIEKRKDTCLKVFEKNNYSANNPIVNAKLFKFHDLIKVKKVKFADPLIISIHYIIYYTNLKKDQQMLNLFSSQEKKYNENTNSFGLEIMSNVDDILLDPIKVNVNDDVYINKPNKESVNGSVDSVLECKSQNIEKNYIKPLKSNNYVESSSSCISKYQKPNNRVMKMMQLLKNNDANPDDKLSECNDQEYLPTNHIENSINCDTFENIIDTSMDVDKNMLPLHVCNLLDNDGDEIFINNEMNENNPKITCGFSHNDVNSDENEITNHIVKKNNIRTEQYRPAITNMHSQESMCDINQDISHHKDGQYTSDEDVSIVYLNKEDLNFYSPKEKTDPVEIRKKLRNVVCQRIVNGGIKKHRLTKTFEINDADNIENSSSYKNDTFESSSNQNFNSMDIQEWSSGEDESSIHLESTSLDSNYPRPLKFLRTLKKVPEFYNKEMSYNNIVSSPMSQDHHTSDDTILTDVSHEYETFNNTSKYQSKMNRKKFFPIPKSNTHKVKSSKLSNLTNDKNIVKTLGKSDSDNQNKLEDVFVKFENNCNKELYKKLFIQYNGNETKVFLHLMENQRMFYNGELVLSGNASTDSSNYIKNHSIDLYKWYGNPKNTDANQSYLQHVPDQFSPDNEPSVNIGDICSISSPSMFHSNDSIATVANHIVPLNQLSHVKDDVTTNTTSEIIEVYDYSNFSSPTSDHLDDLTSTMKDYDKEKDDNITTTTTLDTNDIIYISSENSVNLNNQVSTMTNHVMPLNQETHIQDDAITNSTFITSKPTTSSGINNSDKQTLTTEKPKCNFQLPVAIRSTIVNQSSFLSPTAVRSRGMPFGQTHRFLQPNCISNIRPMFNYNNNRG